MELHGVEVGNHKVSQSVSQSEGISRKAPMPVFLCLSGFNVLGRSGSHVPKRQRPSNVLL